MVSIVLPSLCSSKVTVKRKQSGSAGPALLREFWGADLLTAESLRQNWPAALHDFSETRPESAAAFSRLLAPGGVIFGRQLAQEIDLSIVRG